MRVFAARQSLRVHGMQATTPPHSPASPPGRTWHRSSDAGSPGSNDGKYQLGSRSLDGRPSHTRSTSLSSEQSPELPPVAASMRTQSADIVGRLSPQTPFSPFEGSESSNSKSSTPAAQSPEKVPELSALPESSMSSPAEVSPPSAPQAALSGDSDDFAFGSFETAASENNAPANTPPVGAPASAEEAPALAPEEAIALKEPPAASDEDDEFGDFDEAEPAAAALSADPPAAAPAEVVPPPEQPVPQPEASAEPSQPARPAALAFPKAAAAVAQLADSSAGGNLTSILDLSQQDFQAKVAEILLAGFAGWKLDAAAYAPEVEPGSIPTLADLQQDQPQRPEPHQHVVPIVWRSSQVGIGPGRGVPLLRLSARFPVSCMPLPGSTVVLGTKTGTAMPVAAAMSSTQQSLFRIILALSSDAGSPGSSHGKTSLAATRWTSAPASHPAV